jgi:hypothetical protein
MARAAPLSYTDGRLSTARGAPAELPWGTQAVWPLRCLTGPTRKWHHPVDCPVTGTPVSRLASALPCPAGRSVPGRGGPERRRLRDRTGPTLGPHWVRGAPGPQGHERSTTGTTGNEEPQVAWPIAQAAGTTPTSGSHCGPEGRGFESLTQLP